jgi:urocanate hydratase
VTFTLNKPVPIATPTASTLNAITQANHAFTNLMQFASGLRDTYLGGQLLYAGGLDELSRIFTIAANIAGAATLAASSEPSAPRLAQREGVIDFVVNSLDEALRILKNEIRKHQPVAVAVSQEPSIMEREMIRRGVRPDLLPARFDAAPLPHAHSTFLSQGAKQVPSTPTHAARRHFIWTAPAEYARNMAAFDALLAGYLAPDDRVNLRWLRLSPRYLGPAARRLRSLSCDQATAAQIISRLGPPLNQ